VIFFEKEVLPSFLCRLKPEKLEKDLDKYSESAKMRRGERIGLSEFAAYLEVPVSDTLEDMFSLFDEVGPLRGVSAAKPVTFQNSSGSQIPKTSLTLSVWFISACLGRSSHS
jgi:hypothetical protein